MYHHVSYIPHYTKAPVEIIRQAYSDTKREKEDYDEFITPLNKLLRKMHRGTNSSCVPAVTVVLQLREFLIGVYGLQIYRMERVDEEHYYKRRVKKGIK